MRIVSTTGMRIFSIFDYKRVLPALKVSGHIQSVAGGKADVTANGKVARNLGKKG